MRRTMTEAQRQLSVQRVLADGGTLSTLLGTIMLSAARYNPEIWLNGYPPAIRQKVGPMSPRAKRQGTLLIIPFMAIFFGVLVYSNLRLRKQNGGNLSFLAAFLNAYAVFMTFNLFDLVVLDYLVFIKLRPDFVVLPGTEGMEAYGNVRFHLMAFLKGIGLGVVPSLIIAFLTRRR
ncbi:MAG: hypothetical protein AVDCRST_MAG93-269 [uncultured Chloroflexia bacterium]|uniref:Uncharacterized protein n=1 Tax=uncultured Chloroflexia bacterium TaxID=1672391 RepID=A0A6J4H765_9CHLR|nr:MAG: hypothetical protein AVDCRST_MAG93-269 [uncultured Chloroflexia bacterium]